MVARDRLEGPAVLSATQGALAARSSPLSPVEACAFFAPLDRWVAPLRALGRWPAVDEIDRALSADARVRFELAPPKPRSARARSTRDEVGYDARIVTQGAVPTRARSLHDLMNAIVWAAFPLAKRGLHERQRELVASSLDPSRRTIEHDTIAMLDEGGVLLFDATPDEAPVSPTECFVFGHALYQHLAEGRGPVYGLGVTLEAPEHGKVGWTLGSADRALAGMLSSRERFLSHRCFPRVKVG